MEQTKIKKPKLVGKTCDIVFKYTSTIDGETKTMYETMEVPLTATEKYIKKLLYWFNAEEQAIEARPLNDFGGVNTYKAEIRSFIKIDKKTERKTPSNEMEFGKWVVQKDTLI